MPKYPILSAIGFFIIALIFLAVSFYSLRNDFLIYVFGQETAGEVTDIVRSRRSIRVNYCYTVNQEKVCTDQRLQKIVNFHSYSFGELITVRYYKNNPLTSAIVGTESQIIMDGLLLVLGGLMTYKGIRLIHDR